jgi:dihydrofolate reductase
LLLGRVTYDGFAAAWPSMTDEAGFADQMNSIAKYVVTSRPDNLTWKNSTRLDGDAAAAVGALVVYPISLGAGKRVFGEGA